MCSECQESTRMKLLEDSIFDGNHSCALPIKFNENIVCFNALHTEKIEGFNLLLSKIYLLPVIYWFKSNVDGGLKLCAIIAKHVFTLQDKSVHTVWWVGMLTASTHIIMSASNSNVCP